MENTPELMGIPVTVDDICTVQNGIGNGKQTYLRMDALPENLLSADKNLLLLPEMIDGTVMIPVKKHWEHDSAYTVDVSPEGVSREREINANYQMLAKVSVGPVEYALAEHPKTHMLATWERTPGNDKDGEKNYYWGHYHDDKEKALRDFCARATEKFRELYGERKPSIREQLAAKPPERQASAKPRAREAAL